MMSVNDKIILITGASSGIGLATANLFSQRGWHVIAGYRGKKTLPADLMSRQRITAMELDITVPGTVSEAVSRITGSFGHINVLVNNAGYGLVGPMEEATDRMIQREIDVNIIGLIRVTRACLPLLRKANPRKIINISSISGRIGFPFYSIYCTTKFAVEGFSESLNHELLPLGIGVAVVEPGPTNTDFFSRSAEFVHCPDSSPYKKFYDRYFASMQRANRQNRQSPVTVAQTIWSAVHNSDHSRIRYPSGHAAQALMAMRTLMPDYIFQAIMGFRYRRMLR